MDYGIFFSLFGVVSLGLKILLKHENNNHHAVLIPMSTMFILILFLILTTLLLISHILNKYINLQPKYSALNFEDFVHKIQSVYFCISFVSVLKISTNLMFLTWCYNISISIVWIQLAVESFIMGWGRCFSKWLILYSILYDIQHLCTSTAVLAKLQAL